MYNDFYTNTQIPYTIVTLIPNFFIFSYIYSSFQFFSNQHSNSKLRLILINFKQSQF